MTRALLLAAAGAAALLLGRARQALADHGAAPGRTDAHPLLVAALAAALTLAVGIAIVVLVMRLTGKTSRSG